MQRIATCTAFTLLVAFAARAEAQPSIASTAGSWVHKSVVTITGSGFGSKPAAAPVVWDDASGSDISAKWNGAWPNCNGNSANNLTYRTPSQTGRDVPLPHTRHSRYIAGAHNGPSPGPQCGYDVILWKVRTIASFPAYTYASWYQRADNDWHFGDDDNFKTFAYSEGAETPYNFPNNWYVEYHPRPTSATSIPAWHLNDDAFGMPTQSLQDPDQQGRSWHWDYAVNPMGGSWAKVEMEIKYTNANDGYVKVWENGVLVVDYRGPTDRMPGTVRTEGIGGYARNYPYDTNWRYFSDVYLDYSRARVILGNAPTFAASTVREVQVPVSWSDTAIEVSVNLGTFADGQPVYVYVVDENGTVSPAGVPVTAVPGGVIADVTPPSVSVLPVVGGPTLRGIAPLIATAFDDTGVVGVQFRIDGEPFGPEDTSAPYTATWNTVDTPNGAHRITAIARDAVGNQRVSLALDVTTSNLTAPTTKGLVASYSFGDAPGTTVKDASGHEHDGLLSGGVTFSTEGHDGTALSFNGVDGLVTIPDSDDLDLTTGMTIEAWVKPTALSGWRTVLMKEGPSGLAYALYANNGAPSPSITINTGPGDSDVHGGAAPVGVWTHLAGTYDGAMLRLFANGVQVATREVSGAALASEGVLRIGGNNSFVGGEFFAGLIDDVRVYNRALSAGEIAVDMATPVVLPPAELTVFGPVNYLPIGRTVSDRRTFSLNDTTGQFVLRATAKGPVTATVALNGSAVIRSTDPWQSIGDGLSRIEIPVTVRPGTNETMTMVPLRPGTSLSLQIVQIH